MFGKDPGAWRTWGLALLGLASSLILTPTSPSRGAETARVSLKALHGPDGRMIDLTAPERGVTASSSTPPSARSPTPTARRSTRWSGSSRRRR